MGATTAAGLPADVILAISENISEDTGTLLNCIRVCRSWRSTIEPLLYRKVSFPEHAKLVLFWKQLEQRKYLGQYVQSLTLTAEPGRQAKPELVARLWKKCPNLKVFISVLHGYGQNVLAENRHVMKLSKYCKKAQVIAIAPATKITDLGLLAMAANRPHLRSLDLPSARKVGDEAWMKLVDRCPRLERLNLSRTDVTYRAALYIVKNAKHLILLKLAECSLYESNIQGLRKHVPPKLELVTIPDPDPESESDSDKDSDEYSDESRNGWWRNCNTSDDSDDRDSGDSW
ncbi:hypothetical protein DFS34DRAFT_598688 [Phlyctochytrium arcticum]|nr:hypothetical protein DFS34DRAFT_598688 [Phlyctochytrium arcticum]